MEQLLQLPLLLFTRSFGSKLGLDQVRFRLFSSCNPSNYTDVLLYSFILLTILFVVTLVHGMFDYEGRQAKKDGLAPMDSNAPLDPNAVNKGANTNVEKGGSSVPLAPPVPIVKN